MTELAGTDSAAAELIAFAFALSEVAGAAHAARAKETATHEAEAEKRMG
jgi:hypothetical protein